MSYNTDYLCSGQILSLLAHLPDIIELFLPGMVRFLRRQLPQDLRVFPSCVFIRPLQLPLGFSTLTQ